MAGRLLSKFSLSRWSHSKFHNIELTNDRDNKAATVATSGNRNKAVFYCRMMIMMIIDLGELRTIEVDLLFDVTNHTTPPSTLVLFN